MSEENKPVKLNLACGQRKVEGFLGVDNVKLDGVDIVQDLESYPLDFPDNYADEVFINHYIEHVKDLIFFMNELHRIMKQGAKATVVAPYYASIRAWQDPTHVRAISEATFLYFNKGWREANKLDHYNITTDFDFSYSYMLNLDWANRSQEARDFAIRHYINVINDIQVILTKR